MSIVPRVSVTEENLCVCSYGTACWFFFWVDGTTPFRFTKGMDSKWLNFGENGSTPVLFRPPTVSDVMLANY